MNYIKLMMAFDISGNNIVEQKEFVELIENAMIYTNSDQLPASPRGGDSPPVNAKRASPKGKNQDAAPIPATLNLVDTINPQDRLNAKQSINYMKELLEVEKRVEDPHDDIEKIFDKITAWKKKAGDLDQQEKMVAKILKPKNKLKIHNMKTVLQKLNELKSRIGLDNDEVSIIAYSSIDRDWFTNMIIMQGEFLKWFNLNFEGEGREEMDFIDSKTS